MIALNGTSVADCLVILKLNMQFQVCIVYRSEDGLWIWDRRGEWSLDICRPQLLGLCKRDHPTWLPDWTYSMAYAFSCSISLISILISLCTVRYIPSWFPYAEFRRAASLLNGEYIKMRELPFEYATEHMVSIGKLVLKETISEEKSMTGYRRRSCELSISLAQGSQISGGC